MFFIVYVFVLGIIGFVIIALVKNHIDLSAAGKKARKGFPESFGGVDFAQFQNNFAAYQMHRQAMDMHNQAVNMHNHMHENMVNLHNHTVEMHNINSFHNHMM